MTLVPSLSSQTPGHLGWGQPAEQTSALKELFPQGRETALGDGSTWASRGLAPVCDVCTVFSFCAVQSFDLELLHVLLAESGLAAV